MSDTTVNLTGLDTTAQQEKLVSAFEGLADGAAFVAEAATDLQPLLPSFQARFWGGFDWYPLESGPGAWRVFVRRLTGREKGRGLKDFMTTDHHRCDELFAAMENAAQANDLAKAGPLFTGFETGMRHHFDMEEKGFFPAFEQATGMTQGPTMVMRMEHRQMLGVIAQMRQAMNQGDLAGVARAGSTLVVLMRQHNIKEEQMLYPMGEMHLDGVEQLLKKMQAIPVA